MVNNENVPEWLKIEDSKNVPFIEGVPFWVWRTMGKEWREENGLPDLASYATEPVLCRESKKKGPLKKCGRPMKYLTLINALKPKELYTGASIAKFAEDNNLLIDKNKDPKEEKNRIRVSLSRFANYHKFPIGGDGKVHRKGQAPASGWYGWRWQRAATGGIK